MAVLRCHRDPAELAQRNRWEKQAFLIDLVLLWPLSMCLVQPMCNLMQFPDIEQIKWPKSFYLLNVKFLSYQTMSRVSNFGCSVNAVRPVQRVPSILKSLGSRVAEETQHKWKSWRSNHHTSWPCPSPKTSAATSPRAKNAPRTWRIPVQRKQSCPYHIVLTHWQLQKAVTGKNTNYSSLPTWQVCGHFNGCTVNWLHLHSTFQP